MDRLHRIRMLFGDEKINKLQNTTIMVVGCGAVGSFATEALARSGIGNIILIDCDVIEESNINRQLFALDSTIGKPKVDVAAKRIFDINPKIKTTPLKIFFDPNTQLDIKPDFVIDAIDTARSKLALYKWCQKNNIPIISSMGAARKTDVTQIRIGPLSKTTVCPLAAHMRRMARDAGIADINVVYSTQSPNNNVNGHTFGSIITVTGIFGLTMANYAIDYIVNTKTRSTPAKSD
ncbi:MAG: tRNA threonylcarbamoyladenosine dehydratase [Alphaproteobacteria bacterium]|nr:tRNA threonylcarbamoyladenosine dehydratase [Alphaproteobacteria bacterium]